MESPEVPFRSVLAIVCDGGAVGHVRVLDPLTYLARTGRVRCAATARVAALEELLGFELVVVQRQHDAALAGLLEEARRRGVAVVYEIDDDLPGLPPENPVSRLFPPGSPQREGITAVARAADGVVVSTPELAAVFRAVHPRVVVVPNCIDFGLRDWTTRPPRTAGRLVVGWAGGATHVADLELIRPAVAEILKADPRIDFAVLSTPGVQQWIARDWKLPAKRLQTPPWRDWPSYPAALAEFDIGLAPLVDAPFNRSKSNLKVLECGAWSMPVVASPVAPYAATLVDGENGLFAATPREWRDHVLGLAADPARRAALGGALGALVRERYDLGREWPRWPLGWAAAAGREATTSSRR